MVVIDKNLNAREKLVTHSLVLFIYGERMYVCFFYLWGAYVWFFYLWGAYVCMFFSTKSFNLPQCEVQVFFLSPEC